MSTGDMTKESLQARQEVIRELWSEVDAYIKQKYDADLPVHMMQKTVYEQLKLLVSKGSMTVQEWRDLTGGNVPTGDPFHPLIKMEKDKIILDHAALLRIGPADMYAWHYAVLQAVRGTN